MKADLEPHEKGYMKPPKRARFKPGKSGNPKGRPKRADDPYTSLQKVLARRIPVAGGAARMSLMEALIRRLRERALAGDRRALQLSQKILKMHATSQSPDHQSAHHGLKAVKLRLARLIDAHVPDDEDQDASRGT